MTISAINLGNTFTNGSGTTVLGGLSSGLNTQSVINSIVAAQSSQITPLQDKINVNNSQASALNTLQQLLNALQAAASPLASPNSPDSTNNLWAVNTSNITSNTAQAASNYLTATVASGTASGSYTISNIASLASAGTQQTNAFSASTVPIVVASGATAGLFNAGTITINGPLGNGNVTFHTGDTLTQVVADFNAVSSSTGLKAAATESNGSYTLTFTNTATGNAASFNLVPTASGVTTDPNGVLSALTSNAYSVAATSAAVVVSTGATAGQFNAGTITIQGPKGTGSITLSAGDSLAQVATDFNIASSSTGLTATVTGTSGAYTLSFTNTATGGAASFNLTEPSFGLTADASGVFSAQAQDTYSVSATGDSVVVASGATAGELNAGTITIKGPKGTGSVVFTAGDSLAQVATDFNNASSSTGLTATVTGTAGNYTLSFTNTATGNPVSVSLSDSSFIATANTNIVSDPNGVLSAQTTASYTLSPSNTAVVVASGAIAGQFNAGTIQITGPGGSGSVTLKAGDTLSEVAADFNAAESQTGISANVLQTSPGQYTLVFTSTTTGTDSSFDLTSSSTVTSDPSGVLSEFTNSSNPIHFQSAVSGTDAVFELNGTSIDRPTNTISDLISGVTLNLLQNTTAQAGASFTLQIAPDTSSIATGISNFATAYNNFLAFYAQQTQLNTSGTPASSAVLYSDTTLRNIYNQLSDEVNSVVQGISGSNPNKLADVGITFANTPASGTSPEVDDTLSIDSATLQSVLSSNFSGVENVFGASISSSSSDLALFQSPNIAGVTSITLNINQTGTSPFFVGDPSSTSVVGTTAGTFTAGTYTITGPVGSGAITIHAGDDLNQVAADFNAANGTTGLSAAVQEVSSGVYKLAFTHTSGGASTTFDLTKAGLDEAPTYTATYTDPVLGVQTVNLTATSLGTGNGISLAAPSSGALAGLVLIYGGTGDASDLTVSLSQGIADQINNLSTAALTPNTGLIASDLSAISTKTTTTQTQITSITTQVANTRQELLQKYAALESAITTANSALNYLNAQQLAGSSSSG